MVRAGFVVSTLVGPRSGPHMRRYCTGQTTIIENERVNLIYRDRFTAGKQVLSFDTPNKQ